MGHVPTPHPPPVPTWSRGAEGYVLFTVNFAACPEGQFKAEISNATCQVCPTNSESRGEGNAICSCIPPNIRNPERPQDPCTSKLLKITAPCISFDSSTHACRSRREVL